MDKVIRDAISVMSKSIKMDSLWKLDEPWQQTFSFFSDGRWAPYEQTPKQSFSTLALYSWNVDFMLPFPDSRMRQALKCLQAQVSAQADSTATVIFLQECLHSDLHLLASHEWVREHFLLSDLDTNNWTSSYYGTATLVDKRLSVSEAYRLHYSKTNMQRDAFVTGVQLGQREHTIRLINSHLESMAFAPPMRPHQVALAAKHMHNAHGAVMAGDFNAIQDFDQQLHTDNGLKDAYLEMGGDEGAGHTWGQQASTALRQQFGLSRMDKVFFCGGLKLLSLDTFGADVQVEADDEKELIIGLGFDKAWITDHLGVKAVFAIDELADQKL